MSCILNFTLFILKVVVKPATRFDILLAVKLEDSCFVVIETLLAQLLRLSVKLLHFFEINLYNIESSSCAFFFSFDFWLPPQNGFVKSLNSTFRAQYLQSNPVVEKCILIRCVFSLSLSIHFINEKTYAGARHSVARIKCAYTFDSDNWNQRHEHGTREANHSKAHLFTASFRYFEYQEWISLSLCILYNFHNQAKHSLFTYKMFTWKLEFSSRSGNSVTAQCKWETLLLLLLLLF